MYVVSLGGSIVVPDEIDTSYLKKLKQLIDYRIKKGDGFLFIVGGGQTARDYQQELKELSPDVDSETLDWLGIEATRLNAVFLKSLFKDKAYPDLVTDYEDESDLDQGRPLYFGCGFVPGHSTDFDAVKWAEKFETQVVLNFTNVDYVYDKNPEQFKDAEPIDKLSWSRYEEMFGFEWEPGLNSPFDPKAAKEAKKMGLEIVVLNGNDLENVEDYLNGDDFTGTRIFRE